MAKFIISTDSSADLFKSFLSEKNIYCITLKRILDGKELTDSYNSNEDLDVFYEDLKKGALPTTTQLNSYELQQHFENILAKEKSGDIIHLSLSSGLSGTCDNARATAAEINKRLKDRQIYVIDSLIATHGIAQLVDRLIDMRDVNVPTQEAVLKTEYLRDHQQGWVIVGDLFHLKRGGRISGMKAVLGTLLGIKPIITISKSGRLAIEHTAKGPKKAIKYVLEKVKEYGFKANPDIFKNPIYLVRSSQNSTYDDFKKAFLAEYPQAKIKEAVVGPVIGTHLGSGCAIILFEGAKRLDI